MNLYSISQIVNQEYDTYDKAVVCAPDVETARNMHPDGSGAVDWDGYDKGTWVQRPEDVIVRLVGAATNGVDEGVVCSSFRAG